MATGAGFVEGFIGGMNWIGNLWQAGTYLFQGKPGEAFLSLVGTSEARIDKINERGHVFVDYSEVYWTQDMAALLLWGDEPLNDERLMEMGRDILWSAITIGGFYIAEKAWPMIQTMISSGGLYFALGQYAGDLKETIGNLGSPSDYVTAYYSQVDIQTGDSSRHDWIEQATQTYESMFTEAYYDYVTEGERLGVFREETLTYEEFMEQVQEINDTGAIDLEE
jgi:hypothetical protein